MKGSDWYNPDPLMTKVVRKTLGVDENTPVEMQTRFVPQKQGYKVELFCRIKEENLK